MGDWEIKCVSRDPAGNTLAFRGDDPFRWTVWIHDLIDDIEGQRHTYFVTGESGQRVGVVTEVSRQGKNIRSDPSAGDDLLQQLPTC